MGEGALLAAFFAAQSCAGTLLLSSVATVPLIFYVLLTPLNYVALGAYLGFFLDLRQN